MGIRHLGYACQNLSLEEGRKKKDRIMTDRTLRQSGFSLERVGEIAVKNCNDLQPILDWNHSNDIRFFRIGSGIFPFMDHPEIGYTLNDLSTAHREAITAALTRAGAFAKSVGMRLSCHPGPYTCLASPDPKIKDKSILSLNMHSLISDLLGYGEEFAINIHVGGVYEGKDATAERFCEAYTGLDEKVKARLTLENDDKESMWSMTDLYSKIWKRCGVKLVLDIHHHRFCKQESVQEAADMAFESWQGFCEIPKIHYSESKPNSRPQAHSDYIQEPIPDLRGDYDVMIEAKAKDLALLNYRKLCRDWRSENVG
jgi:UV DNA damage endonuclease